MDWQDLDLLRSWMGEALVFLGGHRRSGTTFLGRLLGSHPSIGYWEEPALLEFTANLRPQFEELVRHMAVDARVNTVDAARKGNLRRQFGKHFAPETERVDQIVSTILRHVLCELSSSFARLSGKSYVLDKTPTALPLFAFGSDLLPRARFIHIVRDGRDVVCSQRGWVNADGKPVLPLGQADDIVGLVRRWAKLVSAALALEDGRCRIIRICYEDLMSKPQETILRVLDFLDLQWTAELDVFLERGMSDGLDPSSVGRWRQELTAENLEIVYSEAGEQLAQFGYIAAHR